MTGEQRRRLREAGRKVGELTLDNDILRAAARKRGLEIRRRVSSLAADATANGGQTDSTDDRDDRPRRGTPVLAEHRWG